MLQTNVNIKKKKILCEHEDEGRVFFWNITEYL
jgi:hypothetical protein